MVNLSLGIDFGTTTTAIAFREQGGLPQMLPIGENGRLYMPSAVAFLQAPAETLIGEAALRAGRTADVVTSIKRCLHCDGTRCHELRPSTSATSRRWQWQAANMRRCQGGQIRADGRLWKPEEIVFLIVQEALHRASRILQGRYGDRSLDHLTLFPANLGCSVAFDLGQRQLLARLAQQLGFASLSLKNVVEEPVAAGVGFANLEGLKPGRTLVYDFGGGTFDTAVIDVSHDGDRVAVLASGAVPFLGGDDIDQMIIDYFLEELGRQHELTGTDMAILIEPALDERELRSQAESAKIALSELLDVDVTLNLSVKKVPYTLQLTRERLDQMLATLRRFDGRPLFERSQDCVEEVLRKTRVYKEGRDNGGKIDKQQLLSVEFAALSRDIDYVLLVGGVTKMPFVRRRLEEAFGQDRIFEGFILDDPITAVARGVAYDKEYENLILAAPPYSVIVEHSDGDGEATCQEAYQAYSLLWPSAISASRDDFKYFSDLLEIRGRFAVWLLRHDTGDRVDIYNGVSSGYVRVQIDPWAYIYVLEGHSPGDLVQKHRVQAPWRHELQVIPDLQNEYKGMIDNIRSIYTEK